MDLLAPEGRVVCVEFPTDKPSSTGGLPWALPPKVLKNPEGAHLSEMSAFAKDEHLRAVEVVV